MVLEAARIGVAGAGAQTRRVTHYCSEGCNLEILSVALFKYDWLRIQFDRFGGLGGVLMRAAGSR